MRLIQVLGQAIGIQPLQPMSLLLNLLQIRQQAIILIMPIQLTLTPRLLI
jgi:hypothetical protein